MNMYAVNLVTGIANPHSEEFPYTVAIHNGDFSFVEIEDRQDDSFPRSPTASPFGGVLELAQLG